MSRPPRQNEAVDTSAGAMPGRHPYRTAALVAAGLLLVAGAAAAALYFWLRTYAPLSSIGSYAPGPGLAAPANGAGGKPAYTPRGERQTFDTAFTLSNTGRFAVTLTGLAGTAGETPRPVGLLATDSATASADPGHLHRFHRLRLGPGDSALLVVRWKVGCAGKSGDADRLPVRYDYLSLFHRTQAVTLPFSVSVRCAASPAP